MVEQHHGFNEHELGHALGDGEGQGGLACCSPWDYKQSATTDDWLLCNIVSLQC